MLKFPGYRLRKCPSCLPLHLPVDHIHSFRNAFNFHRILKCDCHLCIVSFPFKLLPAYTVTGMIISLDCIVILLFCFSEYSGTFSVLFISNNILKLSGTPSNAFLHASLCCFATAISCFFLIISIFLKHFNARIKQ